MEQAFRAILLASSGVTALAPAARINWGSIPQGAGYPAVVLNVIDDASGLTLAASDGLSQGRVQVDCYGLTYTAAKSLALAVRAALHAYRGGNFRLIEHAGTRDTREGGTNEAERPFRVSLDFLTHWRA
jgi:hypothetical protein